MNQQLYKNTLIVGAVAIGVIAGVAVGFFAAHRMMGDMAGMTAKKGGGSPLSQHAGEMRGLTQVNTKERPMQDMPGMSAASSGAVAIPAVARQLIGVRSAPVTYASLGQEIRAVGTVGYDERGLTQVTVKTSGWVREVFVDSIGRPVRKGEPLFTFYSPDLLATQDEYLLAVRTQVQLAASPLAEVKANAGSLVASSRERLRLWDVTDLQIATLEHRGTAEPVLTVYAPADGFVLAREAFPGKYVEPGTTLYEVADLSTIWISADIYESEVAAVRLNQPASVTFAAYPGTTFHGKVAYVYPSLNIDTRTVRVRVELPNPGLKLKPGMYGNVLVQTDAVRTLVVPKEAVLETGLRQLVFLDRGQGRYEPASVKLGRRSQDDVEVLEGLKGGDRIVTSANFLLDAESKLTSASSMQAMMGRIGMADWQMRGAHEGKMEGMEGMQGMGDMAGMKGMELAPVIVVMEPRQAGGLTLSLSTVPEKPKAGEILLRLNVTDQVGKPVTNAQVMFVYTMPMPGMSDSKATARHTKDGLYEGTVRFGMGGTWVVTVNLTVPGRPPIAEKFQFSVGDGGR
ncbi:efflux RND transporter periplasmic adaptor subunit [Nitrospira moscoviensis]|uniref:Efflux transporter, RND family, MFP subunit n=1 Tax=Nitrospira moscoviensis TaxID=42253 RepID=A0A0K2GI05_NITMO|nr:efflux RND transporter periplasmic adaptor subunit [Nitrospira moscoviensis]ALA60603.1 Efflux transporter, RND family, MFP subunit [Nitrospira moscoviensis]